MANTQPCREDHKTFFEQLQIAEGLDLRDNRGKEHDLAVILVGVVLAILSNRDGNLSSIHRHMKNHYSQLLQELELNDYDCSVVSRSHLPIILGKVSAKVFTQLIFANFGVKLSKKQKKWFAVDGKEMRGSIKKGEKRGEVVVQAVEQESGATHSQTYYQGNKESEIESGRSLMKENGLLGENLTMDALHCNPTTLSMIAEKGRYVVGLKENQPELKRVISEEIKRSKPRYRTQKSEKQSGRIETRKYAVYDIEKVAKDERWEKSKIKIVIKVDRERIEVKTGKENRETSLYISNERGQMKESCEAIRKHWQVEVNNHVRDMTLAEDKLCVKKPIVNRVMAGVRTLALAILKLTKCCNKKAKLDDFADDFGSLILCLKSIHFL